MRYTCPKISEGFYKSVRACVLNSRLTREVGMEHVHGCKNEKTKLVADQNSIFDNQSIRKELTYKQHRNANDGAQSINERTKKSEMFNVFVNGVGIF